MSNFDLTSVITNDVDLAIREDVGSGDLTASLIPQKTLGEGTILSRVNCVLAGSEWVKTTFQKIDPSIVLNWQYQGGVLHPLEGPAGGPRRPLPPPRPLPSCRTGRLYPHVAAQGPVRAKAARGPPQPSAAYIAQAAIAHVHGARCGGTWGAGPCPWVRVPGPAQARRPLAQACSAAVAVAEETRRSAAAVAE